MTRDVIALRLIIVKDHAPRRVSRLTPCSGRLGDHPAIQSTPSRPSTQTNSRVLLVTRVRPRALALLPEFGRLDGKAVASLAGVAPRDRDSGLVRGRRTIWGRQKAGAGRPLYGDRVGFADIPSGNRAKPDGRHPAQPDDPRLLRTFLRSGKAKNLAITAYMRKRLVIPNATLAKGT